MNLKLLLSVLLVYRSNFQLLHWNAKGKLFYNAHSKAEDYYTKLLEDADKIAEMLPRLDMMPVNYPEAYDMVANYQDSNFVVVDSNKLYEFKDIVDYTNIMFGDIIESIESILKSDELKDIVNVGIKSELEAMYGEYDLILRYLNKRASM